MHLELLLYCMCLIIVACVMFMCVLVEYLLFCIYSYVVVYLCLCLCTVHLELRLLRHLVDVVPLQRLVLPRHGRLWKTRELDMYYGCVHFDVEIQSRRACDILLFCYFNVELSFDINRKPLNKIIIKKIQLFMLKKIQK